MTSRRRAPGKTAKKVFPAPDGTPSACATNRVRRDEGFSLIEVLIVVAVLPLVIGAISVALLSVFTNEKSTANSLTSSGDAQATSAEFVSDVQSATFITTQSTQACNGVAGNLILSLSSDDPSSPPTQTSGRVVSYVEKANAGSSDFTIVRETCSPGTSTLTGTEVMSHNALSSSALTINPSAIGSASQAGWVAVTGISGISLQVNEPSSGTSLTPNSYSLTAVPRTTNSAAGITPFQPVVPVTLLGSSCLTLNGSGSLVNDENGNGYIGFQAPSVCTSGSPPATIKTAGYATGAPNPFQALSPPQTPGVPAAATGCSSGATVTCSTGSYSGTTNNFGGGTLQNISNAVNFDPSTAPVPNVFVFTVPVTIQNDSNVTFEGGSNLTNVTYWFQGGLTIRNSTVTFGPATYIFGQSGSSGSVFSSDAHSTVQAPNGSTGLIFYVPSTGSASVSFQSGTNGTIGGAPSPYRNIALWDNATGGITVGGNGGSGTISLGGIYAPNSGVTYQGNYTDTSAFVVVNGITISGGSSVTATG